MRTRDTVRFLVWLAVLLWVPALVLAQGPPESAPPLAVPSVVYKVRSAEERLDLTVHTSRILSMDDKIVQAQVNNPDVLDLTVLSPNQVQISAKAAGVTQVNLWNEDRKTFTVNVVVFGDVRQLEMVLRSLFPHAALRVTPVANTVAISGYVDKAEHIDRIIRVAEEYYPKVINNMTIGGTQQVLLHVKVMEVSRTKLRRLGFDFSNVTGGSAVTSGAGGGLASIIDTTPSDGSTPWAPIVAKGGTGSFAFGVVNGANAFLGVLDALRRDNLLKIMSEPTLVTVSGRAATFNSGGEIPVPVPQSLGTISIEWKKYGTQIDFVPIVLGNGKIRLEVRPRISELDDSRSMTIDGTTVPGIKSRDADTGVEMQAGQTLAIAGLVQSVVTAENHGLPWISEVPYLGVPFRKVHETVNEVELLILVTPELAEAMDADEVPPCGPGTRTTSPSDWELFMKGHLEVPKCCPAEGPCREGQPADGPMGPPPDGMLLGPGEQIPSPQPADAAGRAIRPTRTAMRPGTANPRQSGRSNPAESYNRYPPSCPNSAAGNSTKLPQNSPPGFIGPVGYDVVK